MTSVFDTLVARLQRVPSLEYLLGLFEDGGEIQRFIDLVREYLPDHYDDIMSFRETGDKIGRFFYWFHQEWFELDDSWVQMAYETGEDSLLGGLINFCPVMLRGFEDDNYHYAYNLFDGWKIMLALMETLADAGARVAIVEEVTPAVGEEAMGKIPAGGWSDSELIRAVEDDDFYCGLAHFVRYVNHRTGLYMLDDWQFEWDMPGWEMEFVEQMRDERPRVTAVWDSIKLLSDWLEESPKENAAELIEFIAGKAPARGQAKAKTLMEVFTGESDG